MVSQTPILENQNGERPRDGQDDTRNQKPIGEQRFVITANLQFGAPEGKHHPEGESNSKLNESGKLTRPLSTLAELWMAGISLIVGILAIWQLSLLRGGNATARVSANAAKAAAIAAEKAITVASETAQKQLSAYVLPTKAEILGLDGTGPMAVRVTVKNSGQTPAFCTSIMVDTWWEGISEVPPPPITGALPTEEGAQIALAAGGEDSYVDEPVSQPRRQDLKGRKAILHATGSANYEDVFGQRHKSIFHFIQGGKSGTVKPTMTLIECDYFDATAATEMAP